MVATRSKWECTFLPPSAFSEEVKLEQSVERRRMEEVFIYFTSTSCPSLASISTSLSSIDIPILANVVLLVLSSQYMQPFPDTTLQETWAGLMLWDLHWDYKDNLMWKKSGTNRKMALVTQMLHTGPVLNSTISEGPNDTLRRNSVPATSTWLQEHTGSRKVYRPTEPPAPRRTNLANTIVHTRHTNGVPVCQ